MKSKLLLIFFLLIIIITGCERKQRIPFARKKQFSFEKHGTLIEDPYHWLKDKTRSKQEIIDYLKAENRYTQDYIEANKELQQKLYKEFIGRLVENDISVKTKMDTFYYYSRKEAKKQYPIYCRQGINSKKEEIYLNINKLAARYNYYNTYELKLSPNHHYLAFGVDTTGYENYFLQIKNLETGEYLNDYVKGVGDITWADNSTLFYTVEDSTGRSYRCYLHRLGELQSEDTLVYEEPDSSFYIWIYKTRSKEYIVMGTGNKITNEMRYLKASEPDKKFKLLEKRIPGVKYYLNHRNNEFFIETNEDDALNFKVMKTQVNKPYRKYWKEFIPHRDSVSIDIKLFKNFMLIRELKNGLKQYKIYDFSTEDYHYIKFPDKVYTVYTALNPNFETRTLRYIYESFTHPYTYYDYDVKKRTAEVIKQQQVKGGFKPENYITERLFADSGDDTEIPISLVYHKDFFELNGKNPLLLYAYGAYGDMTNPYFSISRLSLLNRGFIYAIAHVRGGGEFGKKWHNKGKMLFKKNTFSDFIACAEYLIEKNYTNSDKLVIEGASAGGLLIGAVLNQKPELFQAAVADVPFVDVLNTMFDPTLSATVSEYDEWGNPNKKEYFDYIKSYCPYQNVTRQDYPHLLVLAGFYDRRVNYWEPAKWVAKIRDMKSDNNKVLLKTDMSSGHGGASGRYDFYRDIAFEYTFILDMVGIEE